jgi:ParB family transcriptional regulator, chromosome partitioning protein
MTTHPHHAAESGSTVFIPLHRLKKSPKNVRKTPHPKADIEALAASIAAKGLLQNLVVEPERDGEGSETGYYLVTIGEGRRLAHLLRAKRKEIKKTEPVRCVIDCEHNAHEISLAENVIRSAMHPADQYEAFAALHREEGMAAEDIAARFGVSPHVVRQRLKLGAVSPTLIEAYRHDALTLEALTAFAITDDHARQEQVWEDLPEHGRSRQAILRALSQGQVSSDDRRAVFVGAEAYQAAGGVIVHDLFDEEGGGFFADAALLNRLVREKLQAEAARIEAEGWKWVIVEAEYDHAMAAGMRHVHPEETPVSDEDQAKLDALCQHYNELSDADDGENSEEIWEKLQALDEEMNAISGQEQYRPEDIAIAGAFVCLDPAGEPRIERGLVRAEDWKLRSKEDAGTEGDAETPEGRKPLSDRLVAELTAYRTSALRNALAEHPATALAAVVHALALDMFFPGHEGTCLEIRPKQAWLSGHAPGIDDGPSEQQTALRHAAWGKRLPKEPDQLWAFVAALDQGEQIGLLAHCAALSLNAIRAPKQSPAAAALAHADVLAETVGLDMRTAWTATVTSYFGRVSKERILEAVREGVSKEAADNIAGMKKGAMAEAAETRLAGKGWMPELLRSPPATAP